MPCISSPCAPPSNAGKSGAVGEDCLSARLASAFDGREFRSRLTCRVTQGHVRQDAAHRGGLLSVTFPGRTGKVTSRRAAPGEFVLFSFVRAIEHAENVERLRSLTPGSSPEGRGEI